MNKDLTITPSLKMKFKNKEYKQYLANTILDLGFIAEFMEKLGDKPKTKKRY